MLQFHRIYLERQSDARRKRLRCASETINLQSSIFISPNWRDHRQAATGLPELGVK
ncbi:hypothetical protein D1AOALGA4SA_113 [Olavius algarvensis Delta 1 endosymbiont]|nr:hypothetical protein D1AOALGA4SA_113 [Olavius algarvensis Delta 1 endosymbiont]